MFFEVVGDVGNKETIAEGKGIRELADLKKEFGGKNWRKLKGTATVKLEDGSLHEAEVHWYEAHGVGKRKMKIKRLLD
jgi:hypothetical protein